MKKFVNLLIHKKMLYFKSNYHSKYFFHYYDYNNKKNIFKKNFFFLIKSNTKINSFLKIKFIIKNFLNEWILFFKLNKRQNFYLNTTENFYYFDVKTKKMYVLNYFLLHEFKISQNYEFKTFFFFLNSKLNYVTMIFFYFLQHNINYLLLMLNIIFFCFLKHIVNFFKN